MSDMQPTSAKLRRPPRKKRNGGPGRRKVCSNSETVNENVDDVEECNFLGSAIEAFCQLINEEVSMFFDKVIAEMSKDQLCTLSSLMGKNIKGKYKRIEELVATMVANQ